MYYTYTHTCIHIHGMHINVHTHIAEMWDMLTHILVARLKLLYKQMQGLLDVYTAFFHRWRFQLLRLEPEKEWKVSWSERLDWIAMCLVTRGLSDRFTYTCTHQIQTSLQTGGHCKQHYLHRIRELKTTTWCEVKVQFVFMSLKNGDWIQTHANTQLWLTTELYLTVYVVCFSVCLYVWLF